uniref:Uncharacterized protein n=1 Tax=Arundo donax TaxID=35708 RepID=A0A0A9EPF1_ARUDO
MELVFPKLERHPCLSQTKVRPAFFMLIDAIRVESRGTPENDEPLINVQGDSFALKGRIPCSCEGHLSLVFIVVYDAERCAFDHIKDASFLSRWIPNNVPVPSVVFLVKNLHEIVHTIIPHAGHDSVRFRQRQLEDAIFYLNVSVADLDLDAAGGVGGAGRRSRSRRAHAARQKVLAAAKLPHGVMDGQIDGSINHFVLPPLVVVRRWRCLDGCLSLGLESKHAWWS